MTERIHKTGQSFPGPLLNDLPCSPSAQQGSFRYLINHCIEPYVMTKRPASTTRRLWHGLFGPSKIKITPNNFVNNQLDRLFSDNFIDAEKKRFVSLSKEISILQDVPLDKYVKERQHVIYNLFHLAWDRTTPQSILIEYSFIFIMLVDPRVEAINSGLYGLCLSEHGKLAWISLNLFRDYLLIK